MKTTMKPLLGGALCLLLLTGPAQSETKSKLRPPPTAATSILFDGEWRALPATELYEVVASKSASALSKDLAKASFKEVSEGRAKWLTGHYYTCPEGKRPFLIKGVCPGNGAGEFRVERRGNSLAVVWGSIPGVSTHDLQDTALIVNLDFTPDEIYTDLTLLVR